MSNRKIRDTQEIECLIESLMRAVKSRMEHDKKRDNYDGYSWGWHGRDLVERMEKDAEQFAEHLDSYINKRILEKMRFVKGEFKGA